MSGHSKWATIKRKKGVIDARRGAVFTKLIREITVAARAGGEDPEANPRLRTAILKAKSNNMPADNIERAVKKGAGTLDGVTYEEIRYEGYGPGGVAIMLDCLTDNKNRTTPEIRTLFGKNGGNLGENGCVSYLFEKKGLMVLESGQISEDDLLELLIEFDVEDISTEEENIVVKTEPDSYSDVSEILVNKGLKLITNELSYLPVTNVPLDEKRARQTLRLIELLEDHDDVQDVYSNYEISDEIMNLIYEEQ